MRRAVDAGVILLGSASNDPNRNQDIENDIPSNSPGVLGVSNVNFDGVLQSAYGKNIQVAYYGTGVYVWNGFFEGFRTVKGTSFATPLVALVAAIGKSLDPNLSSKDISKFVNSCEKKISGKRTVGSGCVFSPEKFIPHGILPSQLEIISY
ncbi:Thermostable alkaline protease precursor [compost metagenome]